jgi:hypothetical protein
MGIYQPGREKSSTFSGEAVFSRAPVPCEENRFTVHFSIQNIGTLIFGQLLT